ncbi:MAG: tRNA-binding protein [Thermoplasmata archaeon]|nr:tRNA-binding protein [Thermoplasmata archaeon]
MIEFDDFLKVEMRVGTIVDAELNAKARKPAYKLTIDFGDEFGIKTSSAQITDIYTPETLIGRQVIAVMNFKPIKVADVRSEVLVLGTDTELGVALLQPERHVDNGSRIY